MKILKPAVILISGLTFGVAGAEFGYVIGERAVDPAVQMPQIAACAGKIALAAGSNTEPVRILASNLPESCSPYRYSFNDTNVTVGNPGAVDGPNRQHTELAYDTPSADAFVIAQKAELIRKKVSEPRTFAGLIGGMDLMLGAMFGYSTSLMISRRRQPKNPTDITGIDMLPSSKQPTSPILYARAPKPTKIR